MGGVGGRFVVEGRRYEIGAAYKFEELSCFENKWQTGGNLGGRE